MGKNSIMCGMIMLRLARWDEGMAAARQNGKTAKMEWKRASWGGVGRGWCGRDRTMQNITM